MVAEYTLSPSADGENAASAAELWRPLVDGFAEAVVVCDARHIVRHVNRLAEAYLPTVRIGRPAGAAGLPLPTDAGPAPTCTTTAGRCGCGGSRSGRPGTPGTSAT